jgi:hypothetical protein
VKDFPLGVFFAGFSLCRSILHPHNSFQESHRPVISFQRRIFFHENLDDLERQNHKIPVPLWRRIFLAKNHPANNFPAKNYTGEEYSGKESFASEEIFLERESFGEEFSGEELSGKEFSGEECFANFQTCSTMFFFSF